MKLVGYEGIFGTIATFCLILPILQVVPGREGGGLKEDTLETFHMVSSPPPPSSSLPLPLKSL